MSASPKIACFHDISPDLSKYSFSMLASYGKESSEFWISREGSKWMLPSIKGMFPNHNQEKAFLDALNLDYADVGPNTVISQVVSLKVVFLIERRTVAMTAILTPRQKTVSGKVYEFSWYLEPNKKARCTLN